MDVSEKTLKIIEEKNINPQARWRFLLKDYFFWLLFGLSVIVGAMAVSAVIFMLTVNDWDIYEYLGRSLPEHILISMPYLWITVLLAFLALAFYNFKYTRRGYRYEIRLIIFGSIVLSLIFGLAFFLAGLGEQIHNIFMSQVPFYNNLIYDTRNIWDNPQKGLLAGQITEIKNQDDFMLRDFHGKFWVVEREGFRCCDSSLLQVGKEVEMIGHSGDDDIFFVIMMRPWYTNSINK
jgi:hypothetical protein